MFGGTLVVAVVVALIVGIGGDEPSRPALPTLPPAERQGANGIELSTPTGWERISHNGVVRLRSPEGDVQVLVSSPATAGQAAQALRAELDAIGKSYEVLDASSPVSKKIGGLSGRQVVVAARQSNGKDVRILVITANGKDRAYVVEVVAAADAAGHRITEGQQVVNSLKLTG